MLPVTHVLGVAHAATAHRRTHHLRVHGVALVLVRCGEHVGRSARIDGSLVHTDRMRIDHPVCRVRRVRNTMDWCRHASDHQPIGHAIGNADVNGLAIGALLKGGLLS